MRVCHFPSPCRTELTNVATGEPCVVMKTLGRDKVTFNYLDRSRKWTGIVQPSSGHRLKGLDEL